MRRPAGFRPKKSLGQNFLVDENVARKIVNAVDPQPSDHIVEIGPGAGVLTKYLIAAGSRVHAIEIDARLIADLQKDFGRHQNFTLVHADFRKLDLRSLAGSEKIRIVGNIPYHITSPLIFSAFAQREVLCDLTLTVQKEVAERIVAGPGGKTYGILAIVSQTFASAEMLFTISPHVFRPKPKVESAVVRLQFQPPPVAISDEAFYLHLIKTMFAQRRKTLRRSLKLFLKNTAIDFIDLQRRPETLAVAEIIRLANHLTPMPK